jgi:hypothetical protein
MQGGSDICTWKTKARRPALSAGLNAVAKHLVPSLPDSGEDLLPRIFLHASTAIFPHF